MSVVVTSRRGNSPGRNNVRVKRRIPTVIHHRMSSAFLFCCCALWMACSAKLAQAHATLLQTEPPPGGQLAEAPGRIRLSFDERVETVFNSIEVLDQDGRRVDDGNPRVVGGGDTLELGIKTAGNGKYTVLWRVNSLDGHQVQGQFGFGVNSVPPTEAEMSRLSTPQENISFRIYYMFVKWAGLAAMVTWIGGICFWSFVFVPSLPSFGNAGDGQSALIRAAASRIRGILWIGAISFFISEILALVGQGIIFADLPLSKVLSPETMRAVLAMTSYGQWWNLRMLAALGLLGICAWQVRSHTMKRSVDAPSKRGGVTLVLCESALGGLMLLTVPMSGHARAVAQATALVVACDWAHLAGTSLWIGGLICLWAVVLLFDDRQNLTCEFISRLVHLFSRLARICVLALLVTGAYAAWLHIPTWSAFLSTDYGRVLLFKLVLVTLIFLIAAVNWRRVLPALAGFSSQPEAYGKWANRFRSLITAETLLGVAVLLVVALLTSLPPATAVAMAGPVSLSKVEQGTTVNLKLDSAKVGTVHSLVILKDSAGRAITDAKRVTLFVQMLDMDMGMKTIEAQLTPSGAYQADIPFSMAGRWSVSVQVSPIHGDAFVTEFDISPGI